MNRLLILITLLWSAQIFANDCDLNFKKLGLCGDIKFVKEVSRKHSSDFTLSFTKGKKSVMPTEELAAHLWMRMSSGHEHGSTDVKITKRENDYLVQDVWFLMTGLWKINFELRHEGKVVDKSSFDICIGNECKDLKNISTH